MHAEQWSDTWSEATKRWLIANSIQLHRKKGTPWAIRQALAGIGLKDARIHEGRPSARHNAALRRDGRNAYGHKAGWAVFRLEIDLGNGLGWTGAFERHVWQLVNEYKAVRSHLESVQLLARITDQADDGSAHAIWRAGWQPTSQRTGPRDGRNRRGTRTHASRDGHALYGDGLARGGQWLGLRFGVGQTHPLHIRWRPTSTPLRNRHRDAMLRYDGQQRRGNLRAHEIINIKRYETP